MTNTSRREPFRNIAPHAAPWQVVSLAATVQHRPPQVAHCPAERAQRRSVHGHSVVTEMAQQDQAQIRSLFPNGRVHASPQFFFQSPQLRLPPLAHRLSQYREMPLPSFTAAMRKAQEVERFRLASTTVSSIVFGVAAKLDDPCLVGMQLEAKPREALAQFRQEPLCFRSMLESRNESSRPGESHPQALTDPDMVGIEPRRAHPINTDQVTFPRAPLQSRKVGFPDSGFRLGFPRQVFPRR